MCRLLSVAVLCFLSCCIPAALFAQAGSPAVEPVIAAASSEGEQAIAGFKKPDGWTATLVAAEPEVANIVAFDIDRKGRFWVCESFRQDIGVTDNRGHDNKWLRADLAAQNVQDRIDYHKRLLGDQAITYEQQDDRIRLLQDTTGDGKLDKSTVFASGFNGIEEGTGAGVLAVEDDVYYTCIPKLWKLNDLNGDGQSDQRTALADGFGVRVAFRGHDMHGLIRGPDGRIYFSIGDRGYNVQTAEGNHLFDPGSGAIFRCELDGSDLEVFATGLRNPQELAFDEYGNLFTGDNNSDSGDRARWVYIVQGGDTGWRMNYQYYGDRGPFNREKIWHPFHEEQPAYIVPPIANFADGPSGLTYYPGTGLSDDWKGRFLLADFRGTPANSGIRTFRVKPKGAFFELVDDQQPLWSILATDVAFGPDGGIYVSDWVDGWVGQGKGRIYRFADPEYSESEIVKEVQSLLAGDWNALEEGRLVALLGHADQRVRLAAQWQLAARSDAEAFRRVIQDPTLSTVHRLHGVWGLGQIARGEGLSADLIQAIEPLVVDGDPYLRAAGADLLGSLPNHTVSRHLRDAIDDQDDRVKYFAAMAVGSLRDSESFDAIVRMLERNNNQDPILRHGGIMALSQIASSSQIAELKDHPNRSVRRAAVVALRRQASPLTAEFLSDYEPMVALEAARAINDLPIAEALPALADQIARPTDDDALMRRVLNANFRIGSNDRLVAVAGYAAEPSASESLRLEALEMLSQWKQPDALDRVINHWRPMKPRPDAEVAAAVTDQLSRLLSAPEPIANRAIELAAELEIAEIAPQLISRLSDESIDVQTRAAAMLALAKLDPKGAPGFAGSALAADQPELRIAALRVLAKLEAGNLMPALRDAIASKNPTERQVAWDLLAANESAEATHQIEDGLQQYIDGKLPEDVWLNVVEAAKGRVNPSLASDLAAAEARWAQEDALASYRASLVGGDRIAGEKLFFEKTELSCVRCHRVHRQGGQVGPVLTTIGAQRDRKYLLEAIVRPDAAIAKGFETAVIADDLGQVFTGIIRDETDDEVRLMKADGSEVTIPTEEIVARRRGKSAMPEDLVKQMTPREIRDLVAYLESLKVDPRASGNEIE
ncbi:Cytochrome c [Rosistilla carotiformis]|uniref:Cytochrome c n=1 Tax=Rosistilla carotiformis TaxID=2528017 RepID=A0A518JVS1_9BACT|nr:PVC-type heme-binding CxxCH protein [Rosistilla carotiformis]QDV69634.1 Cytochrome c [Rosistilla carotiformis]